MNSIDKQLNRRSALKVSSLVFLGLSLPSVTHATIALNKPTMGDEKIPEYFPNIDPEVISEVVGKSHFDLDRVRELVERRPELAASVWEWRFGDFESAVGAASHVGRRDIALYLMSKGARPTIYTFAMLGEFEVVKSMVESSPGIQRNSGPHGISLLDHAYAGERMKDTMTKTQDEKLTQTIAFLEELGDAGGPTYKEVSSEDQQKYLGDYSYGNGETDGFTIQLNMRKIMSLGPLGVSGGALYKIGENKFTYNGAPSVTVTFAVENDVVQSLTLSEPKFSITALKVS